MVVFHPTILAIEIFLAVVNILLLFVGTMPWELILFPRSLPSVIVAIIGCQSKVIVILLLTLRCGSGSDDESLEGCCGVFPPRNHHLIIPIVCRRRNDLRP